MRNWKNINDKYVKEGELYLSFDFLNTWKSEILSLNHNKKGGQYQYPTSLFTFLYTLKFAFRLGYRQEQGILNALSKYVSIPAVPSYSQIQRRSVKLKISSLLPKSKSKQVIAIDSSGIKLYNSGQWIREKHKKKSPFLKIHIAVNIDTKQAVAVKITNDSVGDNKVLTTLIDRASCGGNIKKSLLDGAYDTYEIWNELERRNIQPLIRLRRNAVKKYWKSFTRALTVKEYIGNEKEWVKKTGFGQRWQAEMWFSTFKRRFGENCTATKPRNVVHEILFKSVLCNKLII